MYELNGNIKIGKLKFNKVIDCKIESTTRLLSNTAVITLPLSAVFNNTKRLSLSKEIKRGDKVEIELGYDGEFVNEFVGFVKDVSDKGKTVITCEDSMFLLRKPLENKYFKDTTLKDVLQYIVKDTEVSLNTEKLPEINFDSFLLKDITALQALQKIKDNYGLLVFIDYDNKLYAGLSYIYGNGTVKYDLQKNVVGNDLTFKNKDDFKYKIKAVSILKNNKKLEVETGDTDGDLKTLYFRNIKTEKELKELAEQEIEKYKYTGYKGNLTGFGLPISKFGMTIEIKDENYPEREGSYYAESIKVNFGKSGFRRIVELGIKL